MTAEQMELKLIKGEFLEGQTVTVELLETGRQYQRKVKYAKKYGDLYVTINNMGYPYSVVLEDLKYRDTYTALLPNGCTAVGYVDKGAGTFTTLDGIAYNLKEVIL